MKKSRILPVLLTLVAGLVASCENEKSAGDAFLDVSPSYATLRRGGSVTLTASGAENYVWELENAEIGSLSSHHGKTVVYTAQVCETENVTQTVHVYSGVSGGTNGIAQATYSGSATILHRGTGK